VAQYPETRKRGKVQRVARPACASATMHFLLTTTATEQIAFKNQRTVYFSIRAVINYESATRSQGLLDQNSPNL